VAEDNSAVAVWGEFGGAGKSQDLRIRLLGVRHRGLLLASSEHRLKPMPPEHRLKPMLPGLAAEEVGLEDEIQDAVGE